MTNTEFFASLLGVPVEQLAPISATLESAGPFSEDDKRGLTAEKDQIKAYCAAKWHAYKAEKGGATAAHLAIREQMKARQK